VIFRKILVSRLWRIFVFFYRLFGTINLIPKKKEKRRKKEREREREGEKTMILQKSQEKFIQ